MNPIFEYVIIAIAVVCFIAWIGLIITTTQSIVSGDYYKSECHKPTTDNTTTPPKKL